MSSIIKRRSANYSKPELDCLITYLEENPDLLNSKLGDQYKTLNDIRLAWDELADKISAVGGYFGARRTGQEVKRKWADLKSRVKAKAATIAMGSDAPDGISHNMRLSAIDERVLNIISNDHDEASETKSSDAMSLQEFSLPSVVKVFSFQNDSNSEDAFKGSTGNDETARPHSSQGSETDIVEEIKGSGSDDKKRRLSEAFSTSHAEKKAVTMKRLKLLSEEEQLQELCSAQMEINSELRSIKDILKKCQLSIEKIGILKRAELRLKCAKYGVDFEDLFD